MGRGAAFFDLDRTLLRKASGPVFTEALVHAGIAPSRSIPGIGMVYRLNDVLGESAAAMGMARMAANVAKGWQPEAVRAAAEQAAEKLAKEVVPYARPLLDEHRKAGRPVVMATTTPYDMVAPLAISAHRPKNRQIVTLRRSRREKNFLLLGAEKSRHQ